MNDRAFIGRKTIGRLFTIAAGTFVLAGCGQHGSTASTTNNFAVDAAVANTAASDTLVKREPGSWTQKIELKRFEGKGAEEVKADMTKMFAAVSSISICVTPEMAAAEDPVANLQKLGGAKGNCTLDRKSTVGGKFEMSGMCAADGGKKMKINANGKIGSTAQDIDMTVEAQDASGIKEGLMEMQIHSVRNGGCTAKDKRIPPATK